MLSETFETLTMILGISLYRLYTALLSRSVLSVSAPPA